MHSIQNISSLKFQHSDNSSLSIFQAKELSFTVTVIIITLTIKINQKHMQTIKGNCELINIGYISIKYWLNFTKIENELSRYLNDT